MTPSRSAHGQISRRRYRTGPSRPRRRLPGDQLVRPGSRDSGQLGPLGPRHRRDLGQPSASGPCAAAAVARTAPSSEAGAPHMRARERKVFDVATVWSPTPIRSREPASRAISARTYLRSARNCSSVGMSSGNQLRVSRPAPSSYDTATSGRSSMPAAISSEPPPMSNTASRPDDQPNHRRTARNVSRASSSPAKIVELDVGLADDQRDDLVGVAGLADRRRREREHRLAALVLGLDQRPSDEGDQRVDARRRRASRRGVRCSASRSGSLDDDAGSGAAPRCASTTSRWPVLDPMSSTASLMAAG